MTMSWWWWWWPLSKWKYSQQIYLRFASSIWSQWNLKRVREQDKLSFLLFLLFPKFMIRGGISEYSGDFFLCLSGSNTVISISIVIGVFECLIVSRGDEEYSEMRFFSLQMWMFVSVCVSCKSPLTLNEMYANVRHLCYCFGWPASVSEGHHILKCKYNIIVTIDTISCSCEICTK